MFKIKRVSAYLLDFVILFLVVSIISVMAKVVIDDSIMTSITNIIQNYRFGDYSLLEAFHQLALAFQASDKASIISVLITIMTVIFLFVIEPLIFNLQTIGMKIMHLKMQVENKRKVFISLFISSLLIRGLGFYLLAIGGLYLFNADIYLILLIILSISQLILIIYAFFMVLYNNDINLINKLSYIKIVEVKK